MTESTCEPGKGRLTNGDRTVWQTSEGVIHREHGPAIYGDNDSTIWCHHGERHRLGGPAIIYNNGDIEWWIRGYLFELSTYIGVVIANHLMTTSEIVEMRMMYS